MVTTVTLNWIGFMKWATFPDGHSEGVPISGSCIESSSIINTGILVVYEVTITGGGAWGASYTVKIDYVDTNGKPITKTKNESCERPGTRIWSTDFPYKYTAGTYTNLRGVISNVLPC